MQLSQLRRHSAHPDPPFVVKPQLVEARHVIRQHLLPEDCTIRPPVLFGHVYSGKVLAGKTIPDVDTPPFPAGPDWGSKPRLHVFQHDAVLHAIAVHNATIPRNVDKHPIGKERSRRNDPNLVRKQVLIPPPSNNAHRVTTGAAKDNGDLAGDLLSGAHVRGCQHYDPAAPAVQDVRIPVRIDERRTRPNLNRSRENAFRREDREACQRGIERQYGIAASAIHGAHVSELARTITCSPQAPHQRSRKVEQVYLLPVGHNQVLLRGGNRGGKLKHRTGMQDGFVADRVNPRRSVRPGCHRVAQLPVQGDRCRRRLSRVVAAGGADQEDRQCCEATHSAFTCPETRRPLTMERCRLRWRRSGSGLSAHRGRREPPSSRSAGRSVRVVLGDTLAGRIHW